jgi:hypothetical protein
MDHLCLLSWFFYDSGSWSWRWPRYTVYWAILCEPGGRICEHINFGCALHQNRSQSSHLFFHIFNRRIFFYTLHSILACIDEVTELQPIPEAHVPVMKFKFDGISIDLLYASISCLIVPEVSGIFFIFYLVPLSNVPGWKVQPYYSLPIPFSFTLHLRYSIWAMLFKIG